MHSIGRDNRLLTKVKASGKEQVHLNRGIKPANSKSSREHCRIPAAPFQKSTFVQVHRSGRGTFVHLLKGN